MGSAARLLEDYEDVIRTHASWVRTRVANQLIRHGRLEIIEQAAHLLWVDQKERYYEILHDFLGQIPEDAWKDS